MYIQFRSESLHTHYKYRGWLTGDKPLIFISAQTDASASTDLYKSHLNTIDILEFSENL